MAHRKLYRSLEDKVLAGVIGGLSEYADVDSTVLRLLFVLLLLVTGVFPLVIFYLLAIAIVPNAPGGIVSSSEVSPKKESE